MPLDVAPACDHSGAALIPDTLSRSARVLRNVPGMEVPIEDLPYTADSDPYDNRDITHIDGRSYPHSQAAEFCFRSQERKWGYTLGRSYNHLRATVGLSDNSAGSAVVKFEIFADGRSVFAEENAARPIRRRRSFCRMHPDRDACLNTSIPGRRLRGATAEWGEVRRRGTCSARDVQFCEVVVQRYSGIPPTRSPPADQLVPA
jgi:hypothetical protein